MPKQIQKHEFDAITSAILQFPDGASLEDILQNLQPPLARRSLQRRLAFLVKTNQLIIDGRGRATLYKLPHQDKATFQIREESPKELQERYIPISSSSLEIKQNIEKPLYERRPISYNRELLDAYTPNVTMYLPKKMREHLHKIGHVPDGEKPAGTYARQILNRLLIDLSWNSSRLEGNTYSLLETECLLELGEIAEGKDVMETQMILNHKAAIEFLVDTAYEIEFNSATIFNLHALLANNLLSPAACGRLRRIPVGISHTVYHPLAVPHLIEECFQQILTTVNAIANPFEQAFFTILHFPYLQPFEDVNKRVSRLASNIPFIKNNFCPLSFVDVPEQAYIDGILAFYELNKIELLRDLFVWAYERSCDRYSAISRSVREPDPLRLRYRVLIANVIATVIKNSLNKKNADAYIKEQANALLPKQEQARFVEVVETELSELHEGNIARYRIPLSEFKVWYSGWHMRSGGSY